MSTPLPLVTAAASRPGENVYLALARWAGRADRRLLAAWTIMGWLDAAGLAAFLPRLWLLGMPFVCISALGVWGLATQRLRALEAAGAPAAARKQALLAVRAAAVTIGTVAAIAAFYAALLLGMGQRWGVPGG
ncbi:MAG TPA: hypothetical protein VMT21_11525 [Gemmatimonadales bacterium]|nr:hypothetical protein [Gemmatimonadales bacterium]